MNISLKKREEKGFAITNRGNRREFNNYDVLVDGKTVARIEGFLNAGGGTGWSLWHTDGRPYANWKFFRRPDAVAEVVKRYAAQTEA